MKSHHIDHNELIDLLHKGRLPSINAPIISSKRNRLKETFMACMHAVVICSIGEMIVHMTKLKPKLLSSYLNWLLMLL